MQDLAWALRGGGGSVWGVVTKVGIRAFKTPAGGYSVRSVSMTDNFDNGDGGERVAELLEDYMKWAATLGTKWSGKASFRTFVLPKDKRPAT